MTKHSISTVCLLTAAIAVWSIVGYRVFRWMSPKEEPVARAILPKATPVRTTTDSLMLNYRDPFFTGKANATPAKESLNTAPVPSSSLPALGYKGLIRDGNGSVRAMVSFGGRTEGYRRGDIVEGVKLLKITADCLTVRWQGADYNLEAQ